MKYRGKIELLECLAAEYALGTLSGGARRRFERWMREDAALRRTVSEWDERLSPLALALPEVQPPPAVWAAIAARVASNAGARRVPSNSAATRTWWDSLAFWRNWGLLTTGLAAVLLATIALRPPQIIEREVVRTVEVPMKSMQPSYVATLEDAKGNMVFMAYVSRSSDELWVRRVGIPAAGADKSYELWALPAKPGMAVKSLGVIPAGERTTLKLAAMADQTLADFPRFAISLEPAGGSKTGQPTGPVMFQGECHQFW